MNSLGADLRPVAPEEVLEVAALQDRVDRKYLLDDERAARLVALLAPDHRVLDLDGNRVQGYRTTYFDGADRDCYRAHLQGRRRRWKARTRNYLATGLVRLELKTKGLRGRTVKTATDLAGAPAPAADALGPDELEFLEEGLHAAYGHGLDLRLEPVLRVDYRRTTIVRDGGGERVTLDSDLVVRTLGGVVVGGLIPGAVLVESKAGARPGRADGLLRQLGVPEISCSKYCLGVALLDPAVPAAPWRPALRRWFVAGERGDAANATAA